MISFEKCWYSWFTFQQLHPDTDDSVGEPEEEEVLTWFDWYKHKTYVDEEPFYYSLFQGMYDDAEEDAGANGDGGGEESMDAD